MRALMGKVRTRAGLAVIGGVLVATAGAGTAAAMVGSPPPREVADVQPATPETTTSTPKAPAPSPVPEASPAADTPAATVQDVTDPAPEAPTPAPSAAPADTTHEYDPAATFTDEAGQTYLPGPDVPAPKLPGEDGYVPPAG